MGNAIGVFDHLNTWIKNTIKIVTCNQISNRVRGNTCILND